MRFFIIRSQSECYIDKSSLSGSNEDGQAFPFVSVELRPLRPRDLQPLLQGCTVYRFRPFEELIACSYCPATKTLRCGPVKAAPGRVKKSFYISRANCREFYIEIRPP